MLNIPRHPDPTTMLQAVSILIKERLSEESNVEVEEVRPTKLVVLVLSKEFYFDKIWWSCNSDFHSEANVCHIFMSDVKYSKTS